MRTSMWLTLALIQTFVNSTPRLQFVEEQKPPILLTNVANLTDIVSSISSRTARSLRYTLLSRTRKFREQFQIDRFSGDLTVMGTLDREETCSYQDQCTIEIDIVAQSIHGAFFMRLKVIVDIVDINDNDPEFPVSNVTINIPENENTEASFQLPSASDKDGSSGAPLYRISPNDIPFNVILNEQGPVLVLVGELDREVRHEYKALVIAYDDGRPARSSTLSVFINVIDVNDNAPAFMRNIYDTSISDFTEVNTTVLKVTAVDVDQGDNGKITYSLSTSNMPSVKTYFQINSFSGDLYVKFPFRSQGGKQYTIGITASDGGYPSLSAYVNITVDIIDTINNAPVITIQLLFTKDGAAIVHESSEIGTVVALVSVEDSDSGSSGEVVCSLSNPFFDMENMKENTYKVVVKRKLKRDERDIHTVMIRCQDKASHPMSSSSILSIIIDDENDNLPIFESAIYTFIIQENGTIPSYLGTVGILFRDAAIYNSVVYAIEQPNDTQSDIYISSSGHISANSYLDYEETSQIQFFVLASYTGEQSPTATATVFVNITDKNDNAPVFENLVYNFRVLENEPIGFSLGCVSATDSDSEENGNVSYAILNTEYSGRFPFAVLSDGCVRIVDNLNYETANSYEFGIVARDHGRPSLNTTVYVVVTVVDENDNNPVIVFPAQNNDTITIGHNTIPRSQIAIAHAYDIDSGENGKLIYSLIFRNNSSLFEIDSSSGAISTTRDITSNDLDRRIFTLTIVVSDFGRPRLQSETNLTVLIQESVTTDVDKSNRLRNLQVVTVLVCVTIILALAVMTVFCLIKYLDKKRKDVKFAHTKRSFGSDENKDNSNATPGTYTSISSDSRHRLQVFSTSNRTYLVEAANTGTATRQNRQNEVIRSRETKVYRRKDVESSKARMNPPGAANQFSGEVTWKCGLDLVPEYEDNVADILRRHDQLVRSVKARKHPRNKHSYANFPEDSLGYSKDTLGSDSGVGSSDVDVNLTQLTIPV